MKLVWKCMWLPGRSHLGHSISCADTLVVQLSFS